MFDLANLPVIRTIDIYGAADTELPELQDRFYDRAGGFFILY
jgi:hypothetical protein